jgi:hypothetical protein
VWGNHAWASLHELAARGAGIAVMEHFCALLVCCSCRDSIAAFMRLVPLTSADSVSQWLVLAHDFVNAKIGKAKFQGQTRSLSDEDFSFHLVVTLCFFADHHRPAKLEPLFRLLRAFLARRAPWLLPGLQDFSAETLLAGHAACFPESALPWSVVKWAIDSSRLGVR